MDNDMKNLFIIDHPLIQHKLSILRDKNTGAKQFREIVGEISMLMTYESTRDFPLKDVIVETPITKTTCREISGKKVVIVPILRAGLGMVDGVLSIIPTSKVGHIGLYRDPETLEPVEYYCKMPFDIAEREAIIVDPMLATGGSASAAIQFLKGYTDRTIKMMCIIASPEGVRRLEQDHPDVQVFAAALDERLDSHGYIIPGLGDAGDRIFGTK